MNNQPRQDSARHNRRNSATRGFNFWQFGHSGVLTSSIPRCNVAILRSAIYDSPFRVPSVAAALVAQVNEISHLCLVRRVDGELPAMFRGGQFRGIGKAARTSRENQLADGA